MLPDYQNDIKVYQKYGQATFGDAIKMIRLFGLLKVDITPLTLNACIESTGRCKDIWFDSDFRECPEYMATVHAVDSGIRRYDGEILWLSFYFNLDYTPVLRAISIRELLLPREEREKLSIKVSRHGKSWEPLIFLSESEEIPHIKELSLMAAKPSAKLKVVNDSASEHTDTSEVLDSHKVEQEAEHETEQTSVFASAIPEVVAYEDNPADDDQEPQTFVSVEPGTVYDIDFGGLVIPYPRTMKLNTAMGLVIQRPNASYTGNVLVVPLIRTKMPQPYEIVVASTHSSRTLHPGNVVSVPLTAIKAAVMTVDTETLESIVDDLLTTLS